jgi:hypothetical protein
MSKNKPSNTTSENNDSNSTTDNDKIKIEWSVENEDILVEWCDVAQCYRWLHMRSNRKYNRLHMYFTIPTITLSTITGTASFAQASLPQDYQAWASMAIGAINIFIGIITTIQQYLKVSELNEAHRVSALSWDKYARNIRIELAKAPSERIDAKTFLKICRQEFDRLMETSPSIPVNIVADFKNTFKGAEGSNQREIYNNLKKPDILDIIVSSDINRHHWYKDVINEAQQIHNIEKVRQYSCDNTEDMYFNFKHLIGVNNTSARRRSPEMSNLGNNISASRQSSEINNLENKYNASYKNERRPNIDGFYNGTQFLNRNESYNKASPSGSLKKPPITANDINMQLDMNSVDDSEADIENHNVFVNND